MFTKGELQRLRTQNQANRYEFHLTPGGVVQQQVHWQLEREQRQAVDKQEKGFEAASEDFRQNYILKSKEGQAKANFNKTGPNESQEHKISM